MRTLFIAAASALFFAALITELYMRLWPGQYFALLMLSFVALLVSGLLNLRLAARADRRAGTPAATAPAGRGDNRSTREPRAREAEARPEGRRPRQGRNDNRRDSGGGRDSSGGRDSGTGREGGGRDTSGSSRPAPAPEPLPEGPRESGTVKWFNRTKGFGFVIRENGEEIFVHQRSIRMTGEGDNRRRPALKDGQAVTFVVAEREKGLQAEDVVPVS